MNENASEAIDDLFAKIRLKLLKLRDSDPETVEELKNLLIQVEDWVEKLVVDSLKLQSNEEKTRKTSASRKKEPTQ